MCLKNRKSRKFLENYYVMVLFVFVVSLPILNFNRVFVIGLIMMADIFLIMSTNKFSFLRRELIYYIYILFCLISGLFYLLNGLPVRIFLSAVAGSVLPIFFVFLRQKSIYVKIYENIFRVMLISFIISLLLHIVVPNFYVNYLYYRGYISEMSSFWATYFFQGLFGVTALGTLSSCTALFFLIEYIETRMKRSLIYMFFSLMILFIAGRRSAIAAFLLGVIFIVGYYVLSGSAKRKRLTTIFLILGGGFVGILFYKREFLQRVILRVINISEAVNERNDNWIDNLMNLDLVGWIFGSGLGSKSHQVSEIGGLGVYDSSYIQILTELGLVGFCLFVFCIIYAILKARRKNMDKYSLISLVIMFVFLVQAIGSNVWEFQIISPLFWIAVGYCLHNNSTFAIET